MTAHHIVVMVRAPWASGAVNKHHSATAFACRETENPCG